MSSIQNTAVRKPLTDPSKSLRTNRVFIAWLIAGIVMLVLGVIMLYAGIYFFPRIADEYHLSWLLPSNGFGKDIKEFLKVEFCCVPWK